MALALEMGLARETQVLVQGLRWEVEKRWELVTEVVSMSARRWGKGWEPFRLRIHSTSRPS